MLMNTKPNLLLLHGALGSAAQLKPLAQKLADYYQVHTFTFSGHGGKGNLQQPFCIESFAAELEKWLQDKGLGQMLVFGYSMGGYVALYLASLHPAYFTHILTLGTKFAWTPESAAQEVKRLQPALIEEKVPAFAQSLAKQHHPHDWRLVMTQTADMMLALGNKPPLTADVLATIKVPVKIMRGTEDKMVSEAESQQAAALLPEGSYKSLEGQPHPLEQLDLEMLSREIRS